MGTDNYTKGQTWGALRKAWKGYRIAKAQRDSAKMAEYMEKIHALQRQLGIHRFEPSGNCEGCGMTKSYFQQALSILESWPKDSEKKERIAELKTCRNDGADSSRR